MIEVECGCIERSMIYRYINITGIKRSFFLFRRLKTSFQQGSEYISIIVYY